MKPVLAAMALSLMLAACSQSDEGVRPVDENPSGLTVSNARLLLPPVAGNPAAVYFDVTNEGARDVSLRRADIADAERAVLHDTMGSDHQMDMSEMVPPTIGKGATVKFEPGGKHVMVYDLSPELKAGGKTELTLTIAGGDKVSVAVPVQAAGAER